jgi:phage gp16-like protein
MMQLVLTVDLHVRFLLNQQKVNQLDVKIVSEKTGPKEVSVVETTEVLIEVQEKCIKPHVLNVSKNVKFLSNQVATSQFFVRIVMQKRKIQIQTLKNFN